MDTLAVELTREATAVASRGRSLARRSRPELGLSGLAAREGFVSPEAMVK